MKTKLVYVLTCSPNDHYIEQALMAVYSARHWNPDAHIVLLVDDLTDKLLTGKRAEILSYISEKIVIPFDDAALSMTYRSRFIKTSVRQIIDGDFLFVDCDTINTNSLCVIDSFECILGAVPDSHLAIKNYSQALLDASKEKVKPLGIDLENEEFYFSSGVLYVKDKPQTHALYNKWHEIWLQSAMKGLSIDQPALAKANIDAGYPIEIIDDRFNCVIYTQPDFAKDASIIHFTAFRNPSWLFSKRVLGIIHKEGIQDWMVPFILNPVSTYVPFRFTISRMSFKDLIRSIRTISQGARAYSLHVDRTFSDMQPATRWHKIAKDLFKKKFFVLGSVVCLLTSWCSIKIKRGTLPVPNICAK